VLDLGWVEWVEWVVGMNEGGCCWFEGFEKLQTVMVW
jgi:hypothetical protein